MMLNACLDLDENGDTLVDRFGRYPQKLSNLAIASDRSIDMDFVNSLSCETEKSMAGRGRVLIRASGTEPLLRVLVEAEEAGLVEEVSARLTGLLKERFS